MLDKKIYKKMSKLEQYRTLFNFTQIKTGKEKFFWFLYGLFE